MTTTQTSRYGATQTAPLTNPTEYHATDRPAVTLATLAKSGGRVTRIRRNTETVMGITYVDTTYIHGVMGDGTPVRVRQGIPGGSIPARAYSRALVEWATREGVYAKAVGLLDRGAWSTVTA